MKPIKTTTLLLLGFLIPALLSAVVKYDEGRLLIEGVQLLQDDTDENAYYYLPQFPSLATKADGTLEFLCIKYIGTTGPESNGGLFHALIQFDLPQEQLDAVIAELQKINPKAKVVGPVPLMQAMEDGEEGLASFKVVSSILNNLEGENPFTQNIITSGHAPLLPGSKAALAAKLNQEGATLLWESLQSPTSDVSITINGYYEAAVKGYNAIITAEMSTVYEHFSRLSNEQEEFTREQLRKVVDELIQEQTLNIEVFDRSKALGIKTDDMGQLLDLITDKVVELMFDAENGWSKQPEREAAVEQGQIKGRQKKSWLSNAFGSTEDEKYITDFQYVLKRRKDVRVNKFYLNLSKSTTVKVPVYTSGNLGGIYDALGEDGKYFKVVNMIDSDFEYRDIHFLVDGGFVESFKDILNFVTVRFRKDYGDEAVDVVKEIVIQKKDLEEGTGVQIISYPRLGIKDISWLDYEYRISWSLKGNNLTIQEPPSDEKWLKGSGPAITLIPPFEKRTVEVDADRAFFKEEGIRSATIQFFVILGGKAQPLRSVVLRADDAESISKVLLYQDFEEQVVYQITWYSREGKVEESPKVLEQDYMFLVPPSND